jgi:RNA polymerase sigma-70 factor (ECF subfamily)
MTSRSPHRPLRVLLRRKNRSQKARSNDCGQWGNLILTFCHPSIVAGLEAALAPTLDIADLTRRMSAGDERAYREFYDAYYQRLSRYLLVVAAGNEETAAEALESTLLRVVRHIRIFPSEEVFWSWLTVLARSAFHDQTRKRNRYLSFLERFTRHSQIEAIGPDSREADARMETALTSTLAELPYEERQLVEEKYFQRRSVRELADTFQASEKAIESRLVRIRRKLKEALLLKLKNE